VYHAIVCVKQVPDSTNIRIDPETGNLIRQGVPTILNPYDAHAVAAAVEWKRRLGGKVTILSMGPPAAAAAIRECVELGADRGILLTARAFSGADTLATSYVLAEAIRAVGRTDPVDMVFFGKQAIDGDTAQVGPGVATRLNLPLITYAVEIPELDLGRRIARIRRKTENRDEILEAALPVVLTCEKDIAPIPFASLPDLISSLRFEPEIWSAESPAAFDPAQIGLKGSPTFVWKTGTPSRHAAGEILQTVDTGIEAAVRTAMDRILASPCANLLDGGAQ
jgi:electron transfer flavoprotein beta subunit